jgi:hypothetical protein
VQKGPWALVESSKQVTDAREDVAQMLQVRPKRKKEGIVGHWRLGSHVLLTAPQVKADSVASNATQIEIIGKETGSK